ncbi:MAG: DNA-binding protein [Bacteroidaceae bacterium]|nr:DNA-binding protein [Bacteroidaceae bacterium]
MAIPYSLVLRMNRPGEPEQGNKTYPVAQYDQLLDLNAMAKHMTSHGSKYDKGDIMAVATQLTSCIREQLLLGNKVMLGDLGSFSVMLASKAAANAEEFHTGLISQVKVKWEPSSEFRNLIKEAQFRFVGTREAQIEARKAERERLNALATLQPGTEEDTDTPDNEGGTDLGE